MKTPHEACDCPECDSARAAEPHESNKQVTVSHMQDDGLDIYDLHIKAIGDITLWKDDVPIEPPPDAKPNYIMLAINPESLRHLKEQIDAHIYERELGEAKYDAASPYIRAMREVMHTQRKMLEILQMFDGSERLEAMRMSMIDLSADLTKQLGEKKTI